MRIIRGENKSRRIKPPKSFNARPTTDMAKEALFSIIENHIDINEINALDLFAGTGSISYEFASRGAQNVTAVEITHKYADFIRKTAKILQPEHNIIQVVQGDVFRFLRNAHLNYDVIFADPPYDMEGIEKLPDLIIGNKTLNPEFWLIIEHSKIINFTNHPYFEQQRKYGKVNFSFFKKPESTKDL